MRAKRRTPAKKLKPTNKPNRQSLIRDGQEALRRGMWVNARAAFERAIEMEDTAEAQEGLGWALWWLDSPDASLECREHAYRLFRQRPDNRSAARVAMGLAVDYVDLKNEFAVAIGWIERARRLLSDLPVGPEHGWLALWEGHVARAALNDVSRARSLATQAASLGREFGLVDLEMVAVALEGMLLVDEGHVSEGMTRLDQATAAAVAGEMSNLDAVAQTCCLLIHACERVRDYDRAIQWSHRVEEFCRRWQLRPLFSVCRTYYSAVLMWRGDWAAAEQELVEARKLSTSRPYMTVAATARLGELRRRQGRWDEASRLFEEYESHPLSILGRGEIALAQGDSTHAADLAERFLARVSAEYLVDRATGLDLLIRSALNSGQLPRARQALERLENMRSQLPAEAMLAICSTAEARLLAHENNYERARASFEAAMDGFERCQAPYELAHVRVDYARTLAKLGRTEAANKQVARAAQEFRKLGAVKDAETAVLQPRTSTPLTRRECEILKLVAQGLSDKRMASALNLSEHTIHRHIGNILLKLDASSRAAAVALASKSGLL